MTEKDLEIQEMRRELDRYAELLSEAYLTINELRTEIENLSKDGV